MAAPGHGREIARVGDGATAGAGEDLVDVVSEPATPARAPGAFRVKLSDDGRPHPVLLGAFLADRPQWLAPPGRLPPVRRGLRGNPAGRRAVEVPAFA